MNTKKIFLSISKPYKQDQFSFLDDLKNFINSKGFELITLELIHYSYSSPLQPINHALNECCGTIAIAFERYHSYILYEKENSKNARLYTNKYFTSDWVQIETSMSYSKNMPLLILKPQYICCDGVLDISCKDYYKVIELPAIKKTNMEIYSLMPFSKVKRLKKELTVWLCEASDFHDAKVGRSD